MIDFLVKELNVKGEVAYFKIVNGELEAVLGCCPDCIKYPQHQAEIRNVRKPRKRHDFLLPRKFKSQNISSREEETKKSKQISAKIQKDQKKLQNLL